MNAYILGTTVRLSSTISANGANTSPTSLTAVVRDPSGATTALTPTNDGTGLYHADFTPTVAGVHIFRYVATGFPGAASASVASESPFYVSPSNA